MLLRRFRLWFHPTVETSSDELRAREAEADEAAERELGNMQASRRRFDRASTERQAGLDTINSEIDNADAIMQKAF